MEKKDLPFTIDLKDKVVVITGAGGVICSCLASAIALCGAKVALLDYKLENAQKFADEINANGGKGYCPTSKCFKKRHARRMSPRNIKTIRTC